MNDPRTAVLLKTDSHTAGQIRGIIYDIQKPLRDLRAQWLATPSPRDLNVYTAALRDLCPPSIHFIRFVKSPFGFQFRFNRDAVYVIRCSDTKITWRRIA